jgi:hypothetical protein
MMSFLAILFKTMLLKRLFYPDFLGIRAIFGGRSRWYFPYQLLLL